MFGVVWLEGLAVGNVVEAGRVVEDHDLDHRVWRWVIGVRAKHPEYSPFFLTATKLGDQPWASVLVVVSMLVLMGLARRGTRPLGRWGAWFFLFVVAGGQVLTRILKGYFARARPEEMMRLVVENSYSFPSGHSTTAACFGGVWLFVLWRLLPEGRKWLAWVVLSPVLIVVGCVAASRLWLGVHYFNDVVGGLVLGASWAVLAITVHEFVRAEESVSGGLTAERGER